MNRFAFRFFVLTLLIGVTSLGVSVVLADIPTVSNEADCADFYDPYIATPIGDGLYECSPDTSVPPPPPPYDPCSAPTGDAAAASACDPCSFPFGDAAAASACDPCSLPGGDVAGAGDPAPCTPPPVTNPAPAANPPAAPGKPGEISFNDSDLGVALIHTQDENGGHVLEVYDMHNNTSTGNYMFSITQNDLAPFAGNPPAENTLLHAEGHVAVYVLDTGEIQINVGPDSEGKIHVKIFDGIPWTHVYGYVIEPA